MILMATMCFIYHGKLLERLLLDGLPKLSPKQFGFRNKHSTIDAIRMVIFIPMSVRKMPKRRKGFCVLATLEGNNTFHLVGRTKVMEALERRKAPKYHLQVIDSYIRDMTLLYETENSIERYVVTAGVPQESLFGPFL